MISVLSVDDEEDLLNLGKLFLERYGNITLDTVISPHIGLEKLKQKSYDAIISDYLMPDMDGIEFLKEVRSQFGQIPFILFTGKGKEEVAILALNGGADFYIQKGEDPGTQFFELKEKIETIVSERKASIDLKNSERKLSDIINFLPDATFAIDREGKILLWNRAIEEMTGVSANEMIGKGDYEYALPFYGERKPILIDLVYNPDLKIKNNYSHFIQDGDILTADFSLPHPKGIVTPLWAKAAPLYDQSGEIVGAIETIRDISEREKYESRLRESVERYRTLAESSHDFIYIIDKEDRIVYLNTMAASKLGYPKEEIIGRFRSHFFPDSSNETQKVNIQKVFSSGEAIRVENKIPFRNHDTWQDTHLIPLINQNGDVVEVMGVTRDITEHHNTEIGLRETHDKLENRVIEQTNELRKLYRELEERIKERTAELTITQEASRNANKKLNLLNSITRHDIMNQLTCMKGFFELMKESIHNPENLGDLITQEEKFLSTIMDQILFTRHYQDMGVTDPIWHNIYQLVYLSKQSLPTDSIQFVIKTDDLEVFADPLFERVIYNLIDNSLRYGGDNLTAITISWHAAKSGVSLVLEDNGVGIPDSNKSRIFERGYGQNTGFGLFLAREILSLSGIQINETGLYGTGARFEMTIPMGLYRFHINPVGKRIECL